MIMVDPIATLTANLLAVLKVCLAEVGDLRRGHSVQIYGDRYLSTTEAQSHIIKK
jgi:hypothetical protein